MRIHERIAPVPFERNNDLGKQVEVLLFNQLVMVRDRPSILHGQQIPHFIIQRQQALAQGRVRPHVQFRRIP